MHKIINQQITNAMQYPKLFLVEKFMASGLVGYEDVGDGQYLLRKETLESMLPSIEGRPVVIGHQNVTLDNIEELAVGYVTRATYNPESGEFDCEILVKDDETLKDIKSGKYSVSSSYIPTEMGEGGTYQGIDYDKEILGGTFTHLALVENPRYQDAKILINNIKGDKKMFKKLFKIENSKKNEEEEEVKMNEDDKIEVDGEVVNIKDVIEGYKENKCKKNEQSEEKEEKKEEVEKENTEEDKKGESKENGMQKDELVNEVLNAILSKLQNSTEAKKEDENENEEEEDKKEKENSKGFKVLKNVAKNRPASSSELIYQTRGERIKIGNEKYSK